ncbi:MAG: hypothetical protein SXG53_21585 [Pseudomonadota bacterium]|nr:hypothetical protein [Pseudomonadota bacterium]
MSADTLLEIFRDYETGLYTKAETVARYFHLLACEPDQRKLWAETPRWLQDMITGRFEGLDEAGDLIIIKPRPDIDYASDFRSVKEFLDSEGLL